MCWGGVRWVFILGGRGWMVGRGCVMRVVCWVRWVLCRMVGLGLCGSGRGCWGVCVGRRGVRSGLMLLVCMRVWLGWVLSMGRCLGVCVLRGGVVMMCLRRWCCLGSSVGWWGVLVCIRRCWMRRFMLWLCFWEGGLVGRVCRFRLVVWSFMLRVRLRFGCVCLRRVMMRSRWWSRMRLVGLSRRLSLWLLVRFLRRSWVLLGVFIVIRCSGWSGVRFR